MRIFGNVVFSVSWPVGGNSGIKLLRPLTSWLNLLTSIFVWCSVRVSTLNISNSPSLAYSHGCILAYSRCILLQGKVCCCLWVIHMDSHPFLVPFVCMHFYMQSISGCLSYCGKTKIQTDQSNSSYVYWNIIEYGEFDWSGRFFVFLWWDKQPEIDCTLMHKTTPIHCSHTCPQYRIEHLLWPLHYGLSSRLQYLTPDATHCTNP